MAYHGIAECFGRADRWFTGVVVTNGAGSPRAGIYARLHRRGDAEGPPPRAAQGRLRGRIRLPDPARLPQRRGQGPQPAGRARRPHRDSARRQAATWSTCTTSPTSTIRTSAWRCARSPRCARSAREYRPEKVYGCEVWRDLDWLLDESKLPLPVSDSLQHRRSARGRVRFAGQRRQALRPGHRRAAASRTPRTSPRTAPTKRPR